jgi:hypothetical protein
MSKEEAYLGLVGISGMIAGRRNLASLREIAQIHQFSTPRAGSHQGWQSFCGPPLGGAPKVDRSDRQEG